MSWTVRIAPTFRVLDTIRVLPISLPTAMQTLAIVVALLATALIGFVVIRLKSRKPPSRRISSIEAVAGNSASAPSPGTAPQEKVDPNATRVFVHTATRAPGKPLANTGGAPIVATNLRLRCLSGPQRGNSVDIKGPGLIVGRSPSSDIVVGDACVSARHAWIGVVNGRAILRDLNSTNGTFLNAKMNSPVREVVLSSGDTIFFGGHQANQWRFVAE